MRAKSSRLPARLEGSVEGTCCSAVASVMRSPYLQLSGEKVERKQLARKQDHDGQLLRRLRTVESMMNPFFHVLTTVREVVRSSNSQDPHMGQILKSSLRH